MRDSNRRSEVGVVYRLLGFLCLAAFFVFVAEPSQPGANALAQSNPVPLIYQPLVPDAAAPGGPQFTLTVNGTGFVSGSVVQWNGTALATTFVSSSQLTATVPASDIVSPGTAWVTVNNGVPGSISAPAFLPVIHPTSAIGLGQANYGVGSAPAGLVTGDFNGDGKLDLATANGNDTTVSVLLGNGDGTFQPMAQYQAGMFPGCIAVGDFNGDGKLDLAVGTNTYGGAISVLLGNGDGSFQSPSAFPIPVFPYSVVAADVNGDGKLDLVATLYTNQVVVLLGNGDGTFQTPMEYASSLGTPFQVVAADLNGDGKLDLAIADANSAVSVLLGNGDGSFQSYVEYPVAALCYDVVVADFNGDGKLDVAAAAYADVSILLGNGDGTFQQHMDYRTGIATNYLVTEDLNGDGSLDLAIAGSHQPIFVLFGNGNGTFGNLASYPLAGGINYIPDGLVAGDFNGDGRIDLVSDSYSLNVATVLSQAPSVLAPTQVVFAGVKVGQKSPPTKITLSNDGQTAFTITALGLTGSGSSNFAEINNCPKTLQAGGSCKISVTFTPLTIGRLSAALSVRDTALESGQAVTLSGVGIR